LKQEPGVEVTLVDGDRGELTVLVDGKPSVEKVLEAVRQAGPAATGMKT